MDGARPRPSMSPAFLDAMIPPLIQLLEVKDDAILVLAVVALINYSAAKFPGNKVQLPNQPYKIVKNWMVEVIINYCIIYIYIYVSLTIYIYIYIYILE